MTTKYVPLFSRPRLERTIVGLLFGATVALLAGGVVTMALRLIVAAA